MSFGTNLKKSRTENGYTQEQLAERLGVTAQSVSKWENELSNPDISILPDLAKILGVDINSLFEENPDAPKVVKLSELPDLCYDALISLFAKAQFTFYYGDKKILTSEKLNKRIESLKTDFDLFPDRISYHDQSGFQMVSFDEYGDWRTERFIQHPKTEIYFEKMF